VQADKYVIVQTFVPELAVKAFDVALLDRFSWLDKPE